MGRRAIVLLVALILAGLAAWAVWSFLQGVQEEALAEQEIVDVYRVGAEPIAAGTEGDIVISDFNAGGEIIVKGTARFQDISPDVIDTEEKLRQLLAGRVAAGPISPNAPLTASQWIEVSVDIIPLSEQIPSGKQALTIGTGAIEGVNGFVQPGDRINMIVTLDLRFDLLPEEFTGITVGPEGEEFEEEAPATTTRTVKYTRYVMQGIPVLAAGRSVRPDPEAQTVAPVEGEEAEGAGALPTVFTLEVTPDQAERIIFAFEQGSIWLTLVPEDFVEVETSGVIVDTLFGGNLVEDIFGSG